MGRKDSKELHRPYKEFSRPTMSLLWFKSKNQKRGTEGVWARFEWERGQCNGYNWKNVAPQALQTIFNVNHVNIKQSK